MAAGKAVQRELHSSAVYAANRVEDQAAHAAQLNAYNARDIDAFLEPYAEDVEIYEFPEKLRYKGKETMRKQYGGMFEQTKNLHCELVNRIVTGNTVIDHERVTYGGDKSPVQAVAIYKIENGKIKRVYFTR